MIFRLLTLVACVVFAASAQAQSRDLLMAIEQAANNGQAGEVLAYGQPALVVPVQNRPCMTVGVVYQERKHQRGGPRIDNYQVCPGAEPERINEVSPALPDDPQFKQVVQMAIRSALRYGIQHRDWNDYRLDIRRLSAVDSYGCAQVETIVSSEGMLVSYNVGRLCP
ncbi:hypothetical protein [Sulfuricystis multivorans]|uniref:hypothetical protein n=1 Tax=Sulfuricystis multivorans TaxID=2211108 RepID=UPI000F844BF7|nr:hypothetical protein [Sulfuricystis multivorans]